MIKNTNPFQTLDEVIAVLKNLGAKPLANPFVYDESYRHWTEHILSIRTSRVYNDSYEHYFEVEIHTDLEGLVKLSELTGLSMLREHHSDEYDQWVVRPGSLIKVFTLVAKEVTK